MYFLLWFNLMMNVTFQKETKLAVQGEEMEKLYEMFLAALLNYDEV